MEGVNGGNGGPWTTSHSREMAMKSPSGRETEGEMAGRCIPCSWKRPESLFTTRSK